MTPSRRLAAALGAAVAAAALPVLATSPASAAPTAAPVGCERTSWLAGTHELCAGALVYRDYVMDDYGAGNPLDPTNELVKLAGLSPSAGDQRYPDPSKAGTADLIDLTLTLEGNRLVAVFELNALYEAGSTIGALAIDTDGDQTTGGGEWPGLGISSAGWDVLETVDTGDVETNTLTLTMPAPGGDRWRVQAVTALSDGTVMNAAFRGIDEESELGSSTWWEGKQAAVLDSGDISEFGAEVDVADLRRGVTRAADHTATGYHSRVFTSAYTIGTGEGYSYTPVYGRKGQQELICEQRFHSFGRYQPYSVYVPQSARSGQSAPAGSSPGLQLYLHGCNANHSSQIDGEGFQTQYGEDLGRVIVAPLGRGPIGYYSDISEADVFEALADADATYGFDPDDWHISGYSMGGYGAMRLGSFYPHLWADMSNWVGFTGDVLNNGTGTPLPTTSPSGAIDNTFAYIGNQLWIPSENLYAAADELVQVSSTSALALQMREKGLDHGYYLHPVAEHLTFLALDDWRKEAAASKDRRRVVDPPRVRFTMDAALGNPAYGILHDQAYWASQIRQAAEGYATIDLTTGACGGQLPVRENVNNAGPSPVPWVSEELRTTGTTPVEAPGLSGATTNVRSVVLDARATCFAGKDVPYALTTDGPLTVTLSDGRTLELGEAGDHEGVLARGGAAGPAVDGRSGAGSGAGSATSARALPATGPQALLPLLAAGLLLAGAAVGRRAHRG